mgnify:CR=1 FL=1
MHSLKYTRVTSYKHNRSRYIIDNRIIEIIGIIIDNRNIYQNFLIEKEIIDDSIIEIIDNRNIYQNLLSKKKNLSNKNIHRR